MNRLTDGGTYPGHPVNPVQTRSLGLYSAAWGTRVAASIGLTTISPTRIASSRYGVSDRMNLLIPSATYASSEAMMSSGEPTSQVEAAPVPTLAGAVHRQRSSTSP